MPVFFLNANSCKYLFFHVRTQLSFNKQPEKDPFRYWIVVVTPSLVPRPRLPKLRRGPGTHYVCMRWNSQNSINTFRSRSLHFTYAFQCIGCSHLTPKPEQLASVRHVYEGRDVFVWLPSGYGKSLCYQVLPFVFNCKYSRTDSLVVIVSPLVSLMLTRWMAYSKME